MMVLTLKQEFIELFLNGTKSKEFRTWRTNYRGEIFLHCSKRDASPDMAGCIVAKGELIDIKWNDEFEEYDWEIENIKPLSEKIRVKGKLGLWSYTT